MGGQWRAHPCGRVLVLGETTSTQDSARALVDQGDTETVAVIASHQTCGRGRQGAPWLSQPGACLLMTILVRGRAAQPARLGWLSLAAGVAAAEAVEQVADVSVSLKWPNDVLCGGKKLAGILVEAVGGLLPVALVGIGVNVNVTQLDAAVAETATSLLQATGRTRSVDDLADALLDRMPRWATARDTDILTAWRSRDGTAGTRYTAITEQGAVYGEAVGVTDDGLLVLRVDGDNVITVCSATSSPERHHL